MDEKKYFPEKREENSTVIRNYNNFDKNTEKKKSGLSLPKKQNSRKKTNIIFKKPLYEYFKEYSLYIILFIIIPILFDFLFTMINSGKIQGQRIGELIHFMKTARPIWFAIISYIIARKLFSQWEKYHQWVFLQAIFIGFISGLFIGIFHSIMDFILNIFTVNIVDSLIALFSFLWISWQYVITLSLFIGGFIALHWITANFSQIKSKLMSENSPKTDDDNNDNEIEN